MSNIADSGIEEQQRQWHEGTNAMGLLADMTYFFDRREFHATAYGFRAIVAYDGQLYEVLCNPLYKKAEVK